MMRAISQLWCRVPPRPAWPHLHAVVVDLEYADARGLHICSLLLEFLHASSPISHKANMQSTHASYTSPGQDLCLEQADQVGLLRGSWGIDLVFDQDPSVSG